LKRERKEGRKRDKFYIYSDVTHAHAHTTPNIKHTKTHWSRDQTEGDGAIRMADII
jgi:hypothetical protein